jgi:hypothetical protein
MGLVKTGSLGIESSEIILAASWLVMTKFPFILKLII